MVAGALLAAGALVGAMAWVRSVSGAESHPLMVQPAVPVASVFPTPPESPPVPLITPSPSLRYTSPPPRSTRRSSAPVRTSPPPPRPPALAATYMVVANQDNGFIAALLVRNPGPTPQNWTVRVRYDDAAGVRIGQAWNATISRSGDTTVLTGGPLAPGATQNVGFQATRRGHGRLGPPSCTINGSRCAVR
jgi:Cellulose binding domain